MSHPWYAVAKKGGRILAMYPNRGTAQLWIEQCQAEDSGWEIREVAPPQEDGLTYEERQFRMAGETLTPEALAALVVCVTRTPGDERRCLVKVAQQILISAGRELRRDLEARIHHPKPEGPK